MLSATALQRESVPDAVPGSLEKGGVPGIFFEVFHGSTGETVGPGKEFEVF